MRTVGCRLEERTHIYPNVSRHGEPGKVGAYTGTPTGTPTATPDAVNLFHNSLKSVDPLWDTPASNITLRVRRLYGFHVIPLIEFDVFHIQHDLHRLYRVDKNTDEVTDITPR